jgi:hypothetical protein
MALIIIANICISLSAICLSIFMLFDYKNNLDVDKEETEL